jgi:hypothetical protein
MAKARRRAARPAKKKIRFKSVEQLIKENDTAPSGQEISDIKELRLAGKEVTVQREVLDEGLMYSIEECDEYNYGSWMFEGSAAAKQYTLPDDIDGNDTMLVAPSGAVVIGCQAISRKLIEFIYEKSSNATKGA